MNRLEPRDGAPLIQAFERLAAAAARADAPVSAVLEAASMGVALAVLGLLALAGDRHALVTRTRKTLLSAGAARAAAVDEDARDALDLALEQARRGAALLGGGPLSVLDGPPALEPTPRELARLIQGALDGHAAADVATRLHRSGMASRFAALLPDRPQPRPRARLAADSAPDVRDPAAGRALGTTALGSAALEAFAFPDGHLAVYAEPAIVLSLESHDVELAERAIERPGYLELCLAGDPAEVTLGLGDGSAHIRWTLPLR